MNRKKLKYFGLILMLLALFSIIPLTVTANSSGGNAGGTGGYGGDSCDNGGCNIMWYDSPQNQMIRITAYIYTGGSKATRIAGYQLYTNRLNQKNKWIWIGPGIYSPGYMKWFSQNRVNHVVSEPTDKLAYIQGDASKSTVTTKKTTLNIKYLNFPDLGNNKFRDWFIGILDDPDNAILQQINNDIGLDESKIDAVNGYYYIVESMAFGSTASGPHFYGSAYELALLQKDISYKGTIAPVTSAALYVSTEQSDDEYGLIGNIIKPLNPSHVKNQVKKGAKDKITVDEILSNEGYGLGIFWKKNDRKTCNISFNSNFPIDENGKVLDVVLNSRDKDDATIATSQDIDEGKAVNCCEELLITQFGNDKDSLCDARPECCYDCPSGKNIKEENPTSCTTSFGGSYKDSEGTKSDWYCIKAFDQYSQYFKKNITYTNGETYARVVCIENLTSKLPEQLVTQQSVGTYMVWPTSSLNETNNNKLEFTGTMSCKLSIDKAEIEATGNANSIYQFIYNEAKKYIKDGTADNWYKLNSNTSIQLSYNDDEYGGAKISLVEDESSTDIIISDNGSSNWYSKLNSLSIVITKDISYKLPDDAYKKITTSGIGSNNLSNMFDKINKNQFVLPQFNYGILPISYTAKVSRNISAGAIDYYKLTLTYRNLGDNGKFVNSEKEYTCPYEVTFAPPTNKDDNPDKTQEHDDNNEAYDNYDEGTCVCPKGTTHCSMDLRGYLIKNSKMTCAQAQAIYCNSDRGNMNVEYRVISLTEPFPGSGETATTMAQGGRDIGYNWRDSVNQTTSGGVVSTFILNNRRVKGYEVYNLEPLYVIELDSAKIKAIRDYNKTTTYADFNLTCVNDKDGTICTSPFLDQYVSSGTCHTAHTKDKFYKCADKDVPASEK